MQPLDDSRKRIARRLRAAREQAGLSQGQVARLMGWHRPTISQIEAADRRVSAEELRELAIHYHVSVGWLTGCASDESAGLPPELELAAKELHRLKPEDLNRVIELLRTLRREDKA